MLMKLVAATLLTLPIATKAVAQDIAPETDNRIVRSVTTDDLKAVVMSLDHIIVRSDDDSTLVSAQTEDDKTYSMQGTACNGDKRCNGINIVMTFTRGDSVTPEGLNAANVKYAAANIWATETVIGVSRYLILDGGMALENVRINIQTLLQLGEKTVLHATQYDADTPAEPSTALAPATLDFGNDEGEYAFDGTCDDGRFHDDGADFVYKRAHVMRDATDCRAAMAAQAVKLELDFGDNLGGYADDGTCDDVRFEGEGRSILETDSHIRKDAADCIAAYQKGTISPK